METLATRLIHARELANLTQEKLAKKAGVSQGTIGNAESGVRKNPRELNAIAQALRVNYDWLRFGKGPMRPLLAPVMADPSDERDEELENLRNLHQIQDSASNVGFGRVASARLVPLISWITAGQFEQASDPFEPGDAEDWLPCSKSGSYSSHTYALRVHGDSMTSPYGKSYPDRCIIFVDPECRSPSNGERIIAKLEGTDEVTFKCFMQDAGKVWLKPLNPQHPPIMDPFKVIGTVIGKWEDE